MSALPDTARLALDPAQLRAELPAPMLEARRWLLWQYEMRDGKPTKVPYYTSGGKRGTGLKLDSPEDVAQFDTLEGALRACASGSYAGIGFALGPDADGIHWQGIDLDKVSEKPGLAELVKELPGYVERSPSGNGYHAIGIGKHFSSLGPNGSGIEAYAHGKYFTVTGEAVGGDLEDLAGFVADTLAPLHQRKREGSSEHQAGKVHVTPDQVRDLRSALLHLRSDDRDLWQRLAHALHELGDTGRGLWLEWSATSEKFDPADAARVWDSIKSADRTGYAAVFAAAQASGWVNPGAGSGGGKEGDKAPAAPNPPAGDPVDLFQAQPVPAFPLDVLPPTFQAYATEHADQSGFDPGAYGFALLIEAANIIDHRARLRITDTWSVPAFQWGALVDPSSGGKSPVMQAAANCSQPIYGEIVQESARALAKWHERCGHLNKNEDAPPKPDWVQRDAENATVEGLADQAVTTPEGLVMRMDEMSEWIGRMDAYHKGKGSQDRASYLKAYNGQPTTITRANSRHVHIPNWSVGVLAGVQPEKLASMFKRSGDSADGLFQRFLTYVFQPAAEADFTARLGRFTRMNAENLFRRLSDMDGPKVRPALARDAQMRMQDYVNATRRLATRTASPRLREHIGKFPGFAGRLTLALHVIDAAGADMEPPGEVSAETFERARRLLACLYRHSEAVYAEIDGQAQETMSLARAAAEAILAKSWHTFRRGDLTRHATHWRSADHMATEGAIDLLIELGWIVDITEGPVAGRRGRRSAGTFAVNDQAHALYAPHAERIRRERAERKQALDQVAETRRPEGIS